MHEAAFPGTLTENGKEDVWSYSADYESIVDDGIGPINDEAPTRIPIQHFLHSLMTAMAMSLSLAMRTMRKKNKMMIKTSLVTFCHGTRKKFHTNVPMNCPLTCTPLMAFDNFRMNTRSGRYGAAYNMVGLCFFNDELSLLPKNPTEAKLQATSTRGESTEPT
jgi:hypothetical protein